MRKEHSFSTKWSKCTCKFLCTEALGTPKTHHHSQSYKLLILKPIHALDTTTAGWKKKQSAPLVFHRAGHNKDLMRQFSCSLLTFLHKQPGRPQQPHISMFISHLTWCKSRKCEINAEMHTTCRHQKPHFSHGHTFKPYHTSTSTWAGAPPIFGMSPTEVPVRMYKRLSNGSVSSKS